MYFQNKKLNPKNKNIDFIWKSHYETTISISYSNGCTYFVYTNLD